MMSSKVSIIGLLLVNINHCSRAEETPTFTQERRFEELLRPVKLNNQTLYTYYENYTTVITSGESDDKECKLPGIIPPNSRRTLGNGKMVAFTAIHTHFSILDFRNCSLQSVIRITNGKPYRYDFQLETYAVIPHENTFDVFNLRTRQCNPCRYNDKGELIHVDDKLIPELDGTSNYFLDELKNITNVGDGYLYGFFVFNNKSTTLRVLDSSYKVIREQFLDGENVGLSSTHGHVTVCNTINTCSKSSFDCYSLKCHLLDSDLNEIASAKIHQPDRPPSPVSVEIQNLKTGGAMLAMKFVYFGIGQKIFIQQINADGTVQPVIRFGEYSASYVGLDTFITDVEEYCLLARIDNDGKGDYSQMKCVVPKTSDKN